jgi:hypothetical protein
MVEKYVLLTIVVKLNPFGILSFIPIELLMQIPMVEFRSGDGFVDYCKSGVHNVPLHDPKLV